MCGESNSGPLRFPHGALSQRRNRPHPYSARDSNPEPADPKSAASTNWASAARLAGQPSASRYAPRGGLTALGWSSGVRTHNPCAEPSALVPTAGLEPAAFRSRRCSSAELRRRRALKPGCSHLTASFAPARGAALSAGGQWPNYVRGNAHPLPILGLRGFPRADSGGGRAGAGSRVKKVSLRTFLYTRMGESSE